MDTEEKLKALEKETVLTVEEVKLLLLDIRSFLAEARSPLRARPDSEKADSRDKVGKGVEQNAGR